MIKKLTYMLALAAAVLTACQPKNDIDEPGEVITLNFALQSDYPEDEAASAPQRTLGDPGKDDFVQPGHLYFAVWVEANSNIYMEQVHVTGVSWTAAGKGMYNYSTEYRFKLPSKTLTGNSFHVFAYASAEALTTTPAISGTYNSTEHTIPTTTTPLATMEGMTLAVPTTSADAKRAFFRSLYSTALSECDHNQMATSPTILLRHTASKLDINWECDPAVHATGLTAPSSWSISWSEPTTMKIFKPGETSGTRAMSETVSIDQGNRYNGRYVTYLPMPTTPTFRVTSSSGNINGASTTKDLVLSKGADDNFATWMRALWTIK